VFVVRYERDADPGQGRIAGRVEHVTSGENTRFASPEQFNAFVARVLADQKKRPEHLSLADRPVVSRRNSETKG
jgi:hypothetical protein